MDSSARRTGSELASTLEWAITVRIPSSRQVRRIRSAISPRFAMRIFWNMLTAENPLPLGFQFGERQAVDPGNGIADRLPAPQPGEQLAHALHPASLEEVPDDPEGDLVAHPGLGQVAVRQQRLQ